MNYLGDKLLKDELKNCSDLVQKKIDKLLPQDFSESRLVDSMRYCSLSNGKRIRPFLVINSAKIFGIDLEQSINTAIAIEFIHTYSLIHDDLPAMDDDDMRRGKLSCHKKFDEATAILSGDAFLTYAFEILADSSTHKDAEVRCRLISNIAASAGYKGMVGGQMIDLEKSGQEVTKEEMVKLHRLKTGELFMSCVESGAILGEASSMERRALRYFANDLGLAFQIKDDILDHCDNDNIDTSSYDNTSIVNVIGIEAAKKQLELLKSQAVTRLSIFGGRAKHLVSLVDFVVSRDR